MRLFGTSGIRGRYNEKITPELAMDVGRALGTYKKGKVLVGRDTRTSGEILEKALVSGILSTGSGATTAGVVTTPTLALSARNFDAAVMITASHNPPEYNGLKIIQNNGVSFLPEQERAMEKILEDKSFYRAGWREIKTPEHAEIVQKHVRTITNFISLKKPLKVVIDCANGPSAFVTPFVFRNLGCEVTTINSQPDGSFPGRNPEPAEENLGDLISTVKAVGADLGIAHDGDADRVVAIDEKGNFAPEDKLLALACGYYLKKRPGKIVTTVDASMLVEDVAEEVIRTRVGDVAVAQAVEREKAVFGGEPCGAWIHPGVHLCPDGPLSAALIAAIVSEKPLSELLGSLRSYPIRREKIPCKDKEKYKIMKKLSGEISSLNPLEITTIDGIRAKFGDGWVLIRASGTEPYIRVTAEWKTKEELDSMVEEAKKLIVKHAG